MLKRFLFVLALFTLMVITGCITQRSGMRLPESRPLGKDFETYRAPEKPPLVPTEIPALDEPNGVITLQQALALALIHNPELAAFSWEIRASDARTLQASLLPNPNIDFEVEGIGGTGSRSGFNGAETTIRLGQLIELAGKPSKRRRVASLESELAGWDYETKRLDVLTTVTNAFVDVLAAQKRLALAEELVRLAQQILTTVSQRVEAGKDSPVEKTRAQVVLASVRIEQKQALQDLESARKRLAATWGGKLPIFEGVTGQFDMVLPVPSISEINTFLAQNPDLARWAVEIEKQRAVLELEKTGAIPHPTVFGGMQRFDETDDTAVVFGVSIPLPLINRNQGSVLEAKFNIGKAQEQRKAVEAALYANLAGAHGELTNAFTEVTDLKNEVLPGAQSAFDATRQGYVDGKFDYLLVLDAQRTLFDARVKYVESLAAYHKARADVERLIGQSIDADRMNRQP